MLLPGTTAEVIARNMEALMAAGHPAVQAATIAAEFAAGTQRAAGILFHCAGSVLLLLRRDGECDFPLTWAFPGGGIEEGETPEQAALREVTEECGFTPTEPLRFLDWHDGFTTFVCELAAPFTPTLNHEHLGYVWVPLAGLPQPMHPGCALTLGRVSLQAQAVAIAMGLDERTVDGNGWFEVRDNPISKVGVFPYSGRQLGLQGEEADRIFQVYRPAEELADPACVESFKLIPWVDDHTMIGPNAVDEIPGAQPAEAKGVQGIIGERVRFDPESGYLLANLKAFSSTLAQLIAAGKRELSAGYKCIYERIAGTFNGQAYDFVQRKIRGNHLALVAEGRMGPDVAVMDRLTFSFDAKEATMADEKKPAGDAEPGATGGAMTLEECTKLLSDLAPQVAKLQAAFAALGGTPPAAEVTELDEAANANKPADATPAATPSGEGGEGTPAGVAGDKEPPAAPAMDEAAFVRNMAQRDDFAEGISRHVGTFDHKRMTLAQVVAYGCDKLDLKPEKGHERATLAGFLKAQPAKLPAATVTGQDAAPARVSDGGFVSKYLNQEGA